MTIEVRVNRAIKSRDVGVVVIAKAELASLLIKKGQDLIVKAKLKRMPVLYSASN